MKIVIVGGVAGGATAAARIRRLDEKAEIIVFEKSGYISYANCGLPYYIGGAIEDASALTLQTPESFDSRFRVTMKVRHEVLAVNPDKKTVTVKDLQSGVVFEESYDKLLLSPGAKPFRPNMEGMDSSLIFTLRTVEDTKRIKEFVDTNRPESAVVVGGGFIGIETAENLRELGMDVTLVEASPQLMPPFDGDMAAFLHAQMRKNGVKLLLETMVEGFEEQSTQDVSRTAFGKEKKRMNIRLKNQNTLEADMVVLSIGVVPDTSLAKDAGMELGMKGSIVVNDRMETSLPDIYAVGDAVQIRHSVTGRAALLSLAGPANKQGRIAADNICGKESRYTGGQGSSVLKIFDLTAASTGINERTAKELGLQTDRVILSPMSHAGYYPGGKMMTMKVLFEKETFRLLGAQIVGYDGVDKRIDVLATALKAGMKVTDLRELDLAYAPPYSSAKDPVNMAGYMAENIRDGLVKQWYYEDLADLPQDGSVIRLDVRTKEEFASGHVEGFLNIPVDELRERLAELEPGSGTSEEKKTVYVMCQSGLRSYLAVRILEGHGWAAYNFAGGYRYYDAIKTERVMAEQSAACGMDVF